MVVNENYINNNKELILVKVINKLDNILISTKILHIISLVV